MAQYVFDLERERYWNDVNICAYWLSIILAQRNARIFILAKIITKVENFLIQNQIILTADDFV